MNKIKEVYYDIFTEDEIQKSIKENSCVIFKAKRPVLIGTNCLLKVNLNIGVSDENNYENEIKKLNYISQLTYRPDSMMDHTIVQLKKPLWQSMIETFDGAIGTLPHLLVKQLELRNLTSLTIF